MCFIKKKIKINSISENWRRLDRNINPNLRTPGRNVLLVVELVFISLESDLIVLTAK